MNTKIQDLILCNVGDAITLSDFQTMSNADAISQEFIVKKARRYNAPDNVFSYTGLLVDGADDVSYMILIKTAGQEQEIYVYYLDTEGELYDAKDGQDNCPLWALFDDNLDDLNERIFAVVVSGETEKEVNWDKQSVINGVKFKDGDQEGVCTIGEYYTGDDNSGNNYCLIDLRGGVREGYIEIWYGCPIKEHEITLTKIY